MENPQEFLDKNLEELINLPVNATKVLEGMYITAVENEDCTGCLFTDCHCSGIVENCVDEVKNFILGESK